MYIPFGFAFLYRSRTFPLLRLLALLSLVFGAANRSVAAFIVVNDFNSGEGKCSLVEAIYSANFHNNIAIDFTNPDHFVTTGCVPGDGNDTILLPPFAVFQFDTLVNDAHNPFGPTATPIIFSNITIEANGSRLERVGKLNMRLFAVGAASVDLNPGGPPNIVSGTGSLTIRHAHIKGFVVKGGNGADKGGGGMGAGGAIYVKDGVVVIDSSTFEANGAIGGNGGGVNCNDFGAGGGGGLTGNGGSCGGGGGGSRGNGGDGDSLQGDGHGGGGGGTISNGFSPFSNSGFTDGGFNCGGSGGNGGFLVAADGADGFCPGGGGGGGQDVANPFSSGNGGGGNYGGGGGGGGFPGGNGGNGGFGGGGGGGPIQSVNSGSGGNAGFGGGGGGGDGPGLGGAFGGNADQYHGGGGGALGGAIFNDGGGVRILNSTFTGNFVYRGVSGGGTADNGADAGGAIFSLNGHLTVNDATISGNRSTGSGAGIVMFLLGSPSLAPLFTLENTIIANNSATECSIQGSGVAVSGAGNLIQQNDNCPNVVSMADPQLGPLQDNGGGTPTMAIPHSSPALGSADATTSLPNDQRGVPRPDPGFFDHGVDIGAFELCLNRFGQPCIFSAGIGPPPQFEPLTTQASPAFGGTVNPPSGIFPINQDVTLTATPNPGHFFNGWTGAVHDPHSASTFVTMNAPQTVTAHFALEASSGNDFDGDGKADIGVFRPSNGTWYIIRSRHPNFPFIRQWGMTGDIPVPGDYDGITDIAVWRPSNGTWYVIPSSHPNTFISRQWGVQGDIPVPGDYDGDGITDFAVWRPSTGTWLIIPSSNPTSPIIRQLGVQGDIPVPGDYDGDGKTDMAIWRPSTGTWFIIPSSNPTTFTTRQWGMTGDIPVPGDYDGDGKMDMAVWRPSTGTWLIIPSSNPTTFTSRQWGMTGDIPVPRDYDGDGKTDTAVWRPSNGTWYIIPSSNPTTFTSRQWGLSTDVPVQKPIGQ
jgi:hypothetical protein